MKNSARWTVVSMLPLLCTLGSASAQAQASDFLTESVDGNLVGTSNVVFEIDETANGTNVKLDSLEIPISDPFIDPRTGLPTFSDRITISTITGILTSAPPPIDEAGQDQAENRTLLNLGITFSSGANDSLSVGNQTVSGESGTIMVPAMTVRLPGDTVELNSFTVSFESDADLEPPAGIIDTVEAERRRVLTIGLVSDGAVPVPEPGSLALIGAGLVPLWLIMWRGQRQC